MNCSDDKIAATIKISEMKLEELVGNTPLIKLESIPTNKDVTIYCKLEGQNPGGSVKDRAALGMISGALERGDIKPGDTLWRRPAAIPELHWR